MSISASFRRSRTRSSAKADSACAARKRRWQKSARSLAARSPTSSAGSPAPIAPPRRNNADGLAARNRGTLDERRGAQARPAFDGGARPLRHPRGRRRRGVAPDRRSPVVEFWRGAPSVRARAAGAGDRGRAWHRAAALVRRSRCAHPRLDRWPTAPHRQAARRAQLLPLGQGGAAQAASRRHLPQRPRQGAELAARTRRTRLSHRFPACRSLLAPLLAFPHRGLRGPAAPAQAQTALRARRALAKKSLLTRVWMATGKKLYYRITRDVLHVSDREGGGTRLLYDAPRIAARLKAHPQVREAVVVAFPDRRVGTGLYAFVEGDPGLTERGLHEFLAAETAAKTAPKSPEHLQLTGQLPRAVSGEVRSEILELVAMNQVDLIESLIASDDERVVVARIVADRRNLRDRFAF